MEIENFKPIVLNNREYLIGNSGSVIDDKGRVKKQFVVNGYKRVSISRKSYAVHRLVALVWLENSDCKPCVDHINRIRTDNRVENLRWVTNYENIVNRGISQRTQKYEVDSKSMEIFYEITENFFRKK